MLNLDDMRAEFARHLAADPAARFSMDKALAHVITLAYQAGMSEGLELEIDTARLLHHLHELSRFADRAALVLCTLECETTDEDKNIQDIIDGISTWAPGAMLFHRKVGAGETAPTLNA